MRIESIQFSERKIAIHLKCLFSSDYYSWLLSCTQIITLVFLLCARLTHASFLFLAVAVFFFVVVVVVAVFFSFLELHYIIIILLNSIAPNTIQYRLSNETLKHFQINDLLFSLVAGNQKSDDNNKKDCEEEENYIKCAKEINAFESKKTAYGLDRMDDIHTHSHKQIPTEYIRTHACTQAQLFDGACMMKNNHARCNL